MDKSTENGIGYSVLNELRNADDLTDIVTQLSELILDEFLDEGLLKNIPVVDGVRKIIKAAGSYSDYLLTKKLLAFLTNLADVPKSQRADQISKLTGDPEYRENLGQNLMLLLDKLNDIRKPKMLSNLWRAYIEENIDSNTLFRLSHAVEVVNVEYLSTLRDLYTVGTSTAGLSKSTPEWEQGNLIEPPRGGSSSEKNAASQLDWQKLQHLAMAGLLTMQLGRGGSIGGRAGGFSLNEDGRQFASIALEIEPVVTSSKNGE